MRAVDLHGKFERAFNAGDVEAIVALYEPDAIYVGEDGTAAVGLDAIRESFVAPTRFGGKVTITTLYAIEHGDLALLSNRWTFEAPGYSSSATTAEVARRQPDGTWRYVIDNANAGAARNPA